MIETLANVDPSVVSRVCTALGLRFVESGKFILHDFVNDATVGERELALGICQAHIDGLSTALTLFSPPLRSRLIMGVAENLYSNIRTKT